MDRRDLSIVGMICWLLALILITLGVVSSQNFFPGETIQVNNSLNTLNLNYLIIDNTTAVEGLTFNVSLEQINITLPQNMPPTSFTLILIANESNEQQVVYVSSGSSGGGGHRSSKSPSIIYQYNITTRNITQVQNIVVENKTIVIPNNETQSVNIPHSSFWGWFGLIVVILILLLLIIFVIISLRNSRKRCKEDYNININKEVIQQ
jgi:hypothetical protein